MCFSASASFAASVVLISTGAYCVRVALNKNTAYLPFACVPLAFGIQQGAEGVVWSGIHAGNPATTHSGSLVFLFFSHWFWLCWIPWVALNLECNQVIRRSCRFLCMAGCFYGALLYLPVLINQDWLSTTVIHSSIEYQIPVVLHSVPDAISQMLYVLIISIPLLFSSSAILRTFGRLATVAAGLTYLTFNYAFVSVWCFFAALLSFYIVYSLLKTDTLAPEPYCKELSG